jgi:gliding motility-associated lipoprotein GldH
MNSPRIICAIVFSFLLVSCDPGRVFEENRRIPGRSWNKEQIMQFMVLVKDTIQSHNIYLNIRNSGKYKNSNLFLFITTQAPNGSSIRDTMECILADAKGKWYGNGLGDVYYVRIPFKTNVIFPYQGMYTFEIQHAMRTDDLKGITDVGLRVERAKPR